MKIELRYTLTREEVLSFVKYAGQTSIAMRIASWLALLGLTGFLVWIGLKQIQVGDPVSTMLGVFLVLIACGIITYHVFEKSPRRILRRLSKHPSTAILLREAFVTLDGEGIRYESSRSETLFRWHSFEAIARHDDATILMTDRATAIILPDRVFQSHESRDEALAAIEQYRAMARPFLTKCPTCGYDLEFATSTGCPECGWRPDQRIVR